jgi:hypothetical protein
MRPGRSRLYGVLTIVAGVVAWAQVCPAQVLETETARLRRKGAVQLGVNFEYQTSSEGRESAIPFTFEYGINDRLELVVEPVAATRLRPKTGTRASGAGDTEVTLQYLAVREGRWPALALGGEIKFPTARNSLIGTGRTDFAGILIASKRIGNVDTHLNLVYTFIGRPSGAALSNTVGGAAAVMVPVGRRFRAFSEVLAFTSAGGGEGATLPIPGSSIVPEAAGQEFVGTAGVGMYIKPRWFLSFGVSYDNTHAVLFRPGITFRSK